MNDDVDVRLHDGLRGVPLPAAPEALRDYIVELGQRPSAAGRHRRGPLLLVALVPIAAILLGIIAVVGGSSPKPSPNPSPSSPTASTSGTPTSPGYGFTRPGFAFDPPSGWTDQTAAVSYPVMPEARVVGYFIRGMTICPQGFGSQPPTPAGCQTGATRPGTATLAITEVTHQYPWDLANLKQSTIAGYPGVFRPQGDTQSDWVIESPDGGLYELVLNSPKDEMAANVAVVSRALDSLHLTSWEQPPTVVNGLIHEDPRRGFSFDYPAGWVHYYPADGGVGSSPVVTVASSPLLSSCTTDTRPVGSGASPAPVCESSGPPPGTIEMVFRIGGGVHPEPDWSKANTTIGSQPAFGPTNGKPDYSAGGLVSYGWEFRVQDPLSQQDKTPVTITASLNGPGHPELLAAMNQLVDSIEITPP